MYLTEQLIRHEGLRLHPYKCPAGYWSIGVGRNLEGKGITHQEAMYMMMHDIADAKIGVKQILSNYHIEDYKINLPRRDALINVAYNIGQSSLMGFRKMFSAIYAEDWDKAAVQLLDSKYATEVGGRAVELSNQLRTGAYQRNE